jgi:hypothetical protein
VLRRVFDFLAGTGFKEDLDEVFKRLEITLRKRDYDTRNLERKTDRLEHVDDIIIALLREERLRVTRGSVGAFGMIGGPRTQVTLLFDAKVGRFVRRRLWHPTQKITKTERGVELAMDVSGAVELMSWILGWGDKVEVLEPESLREEIAAEVARVATRYKL